MPDSARKRRLEAAWGSLRKHRALRASTFSISPLNRPCLGVPVHLPFADAIGKFAGNPVHPFPIPGIVRADDGQIVQAAGIELLAQMANAGGPSRIVHPAARPHPVAIRLIHHVIHANDGVAAFGAQPGNKVGNQSRPARIVRPADGVVGPVAQPSGGDHSPSSTSMFRDWA